MVNQEFKAIDGKYKMLPNFGIGCRELGGSKLRVFAHACAVSNLSNVDHNILCKELELYRVQQSELFWFKSYLSNRKQFRRVNDVDMGVGVPRGSCLGSLDFLIYIDDLPQAVNDSTVCMYADDTSL